MSPEQLERAATQGAQIGAIIAHVSGVLAPVIIVLVVAGVGLLVVNAIFGAQVPFRTAFAVTCYANLVAVVGSIMAVAVILFGDPEHFDAQSPVPSNPGFFLNPLETPKPLLALASSFDVFTLWSMGLLGLGFSEATGQKVKPLSVFFTFFGLWMIWVLGKMGLAMLR